LCGHWIKIQRLFQQLSRYAEIADFGSEGHFTAFKSRTTLASLRLNRCHSTRWLWLFENPTSAHSNYATDKHAIKEMLTSSSDEKK
jgi:hypothetical protein